MAKASSKKAADKENKATNKVSAATAEVQENFDANEQFESMNDNTEMNVDQEESESETKENVEMDDNDESVGKEKEQSGGDDGNDEEEQDDEEETPASEWELVKIHPKSQIIASSGFIKCGTDDCDLPACSVWTDTVTKERWHGCIDCQEEWFDGWPSMDDIPEQYRNLEKDHIQALIDKCSKQKRPAMPPFETPPSPMQQNVSASNESNTITPLGSTKQVAKGASKNKKQTSITPTPAKETTKSSKSKEKNSAILQKKHAEWQKAAVKAGGPGARIIVDKKQAKKMIFDLLYDAMKPMNITQIHTVRRKESYCLFTLFVSNERFLTSFLQELKAVVPSPILKSCLDDMALEKGGENQFYDSDDEEDDDKPKKKSSKTSSTVGEDYAGSLAFKGGRNANASLYYVDHTKQKNNGNGLEPDQRNELINNLAKAQQEASMLKAQLQSMTKETTQLLSEPTNEEATATLEQQEAAMTDIREQLESARQLKVNEKHKKQLKKGIESMAAQWRKRKRITIDFLNMMQEATEGTISTKKCLNGDGQMDIDSDEAVIKNSIAYGKKKRALASRPLKKMKVSKGLGGKTTGLSETSGLAADPNFVAVRLDSSGLVQRVYLDDEEKE